MPFLYPFFLFCREAFSYESNFLSIILIINVAYL